MSILRHPTNPILTAADIPYPATLVFQCLATASVDAMIACCKPYTRG